MDMPPSEVSQEGWSYTQQARAVPFVTVPFVGGAVTRGGGGVKGKQRAGKPMCSGTELCPQGMLAPSGDLAVTAQFSSVQSY